MAFNWKSIMNTLNAFRSPQHAINWMLDKGTKKDPQMADALRKMINGGEDPAKVLMQLSSNGQINGRQLTQIKMYYSTARKLGFKYDIPEDVWQKAQNAIDAGAKPQNPRNGGNKFTGF